MTTDRPDFHPDFERWLDAVREGHATEADLKSLSQVLEQDAGARRYYAEYMALCATLGFETLGDSGASGAGGAPDAFCPLTYVYHTDDAAPAHAAGGLVPVGSSAGEAHQSAGSEVFHLGGISVFRGDGSTQGGVKVKHLMWAALLLLLAGMVAWLTLTPNSAQPPIAQRVEPVPSPTEPAEVAVATVGRTLDIQGAAFTVGQPLMAGPYTLDSGVIEIEMSRGATVILQGPCAFELIDDNQMFLAQGELTADVPEQARLFTVKTDAMTLIDLGTKFGARVLPDGSASTAVFVGEVVAHEPDRDPRLQPRRISLLAGQQIDADAQGQLEAAPQPLVLDHGFESTWDAVIHRVAVQGQARFLQTPPASVNYGGYDNSDHLVLFQERTVTLTKPVQAWSRLDARSVPIPTTITPGFRVVSYFLHFSPQSNNKVQATLTFPGQIVGVVSGHQGLLETNDLLGLDTVEYVRSVRPLPENNSLDQRTLDDLQITGEDHNILTLSLSANANMDQARILVVVPEQP